MAASVAASLTPVLHFLATYLLHSTVLFGATWLGFRLFRHSRSPFLTETLWKAASVISLCTAIWQMNGPWTRPLVELSVPRSWSQPSSAVSLAAELSHNQIVQTAQSDVSVTETARTEPHIGERDDLPRLVRDDLADGAAVAWPATTVEDASEVSAEESTRLHAMLPESFPSATVAASQAHSSESAGWDVVVLVTTFVLFLAGGVIRLIGQGYSFRLGLRRSTRLADGIVRELLDELLRDTSVESRVTLLSSAELSEPFACGVVRWKIVLPAGIESWLSRSELKALLAHELAHLVRRDSVWLWWGRLLCTCFPMQPWNFVARREWQATAELQCDDWAVRHIRDPVALARCLANVLEWKNQRSGFVPALAVAGIRSNVSRRVERLLSGSRISDPWVKSVRRRCLMGLVVGVGCVLAYWGPSVSVAAQESFQPTGQAANRTADADHYVQEDNSTTLLFPTNDRQPSRTERVLETADRNDSHVRFSLFGDAVTDHVRDTETELRLLEQDLEQLHVLVARSTSHPSVEEVRKRLTRDTTELRLRWDAIRKHFER